ncbi:G-rich sequence factor 1 [Anabas testudineus]|uniref:RRM domain-containing protein n=1 Tax=Anabas testudineus TaxID=64144 RepID=A0A3Q1HMX1_ANATE|nr:G-rich sequence factor 1 [Anabas testudineus]XP_026199197.1 G-rich sequence factor 1 [Anabas testudineus]XP_026199198.1 G-rich sequence factor 1 [Anabas testudineus]
MSGSSKSLLFLLQRCVAVRQLTSPVGIQTRAGYGFVQQRTWTSAIRAVCLQRVGHLRCSAITSRHSLCTKTGGPCEAEYPPLPDYEPEAEPEKKDVYIVQVKGFSWSCTAQDLLQFFSDCRIRDGVNGIHLTVDRLGRPMGRAFIEMEAEEDVGKALEKHRQYLGQRYVEVYEVTNSDAETILKKVIEAPAQNRVVWVRGLPFSCTEADIVQFFSGLEIVENGITMVTNQRGRKTGEAYVHFSSQQAADEALQRDREVIGNRYIEVFPSRKNEISSTWRQQTISASPLAPHSYSASQANPRTASPQGSAVQLHYIHMRGIPFQASGEDIVKFFSPLVVSKILIECGRDGRPTGEADVYFSCHQDAMAAMSRDRQHIGERYIELFLNSVPYSN